MASKRKDYQFWNAAVMNNRTYRYFLNSFIELAISMFKWENLPDTVDERFMEYTMFYDNHALFFEDSAIGFLCLQCTLQGPYNFYRVPINRRAYAVGDERGQQYSHNCNIKDSVIIWNNKIRTPTYPDVEIFAHRMWEIERTIDVNVKAQKTPVAILCDENERLTMKNLYMKYDGNEPFIFGSKNLDLKNGVTALTTEAPYVADKLQTLKENYYNELCTFLGIPSSVAKKERVQSSEIGANLGRMAASRQSRLDSRRAAADEINRMFGLNITVDYNPEIRQALEMAMTQGKAEKDGEKGGEDK